MFGAEARLSRARFMEVFRTGKKGNSPFFVLVYAPASDGRVIEAAVVVSKKVARRATMRNRLRRRLYHALRAALAESGARGSFIVLARPAAQAATYQELTTAVAGVVAHLFGRGTRTR